VRCVQEEAAARIEAAIEAARDAFEKPRTKGKKDKGHGARAARPAEGRAARSTRPKCGACLFGSLRRLIAAMRRRRAAGGACDRSPTIDSACDGRRQWRLQWI
jgi:hypothetical protein